jgi:hypothetical protein
MNFQERTYKGNHFRPKPFVHFDENKSLFVVATSWGEKQMAENVTKLIVEQINNESSLDATSPFGYIYTLSSRANQLRSAVYMANEMIYRDHNKSEYTAGLEIMCLSYENNTLSWVSSGSPHLFILQNSHFYPVSYNLDLNSQFSSLVTLPSNMIGVDASVHINVASAIVDQKAELYLISRSFVPFDICKLNKPNLESLSKELVRENPQIPFWASQISLSSPRY